MYSELQAFGEQIKSLGAAYTKEAAGGMRCHSKVRLLGRLCSRCSCPDSTNPLAPNPIARLRGMLRINLFGERHLESECRWS